MRAVAARLGVHVGGLYYHVPDKAALLRLMADRLCASVVDDLRPVRRWREDVVDLCIAVRRALLAHRDGARIFAQSPLLASPGALGLMERMMDRIADGLRPVDVATAADTLFSYVTGYVLQEQQHVSPTAFTPESLAELQERFPRVFASKPADSDGAFRAALDAILTGFTAEGATR